jgi:hypothetical protein
MNLDFHDADKFVGRSLALAGLFVITVLSTGCATRMVSDLGIHDETFKSCDRAFMLGDNVWLDYTVAWGNGKRTAKRWASVQLDPHFDPIRPSVEAYPRAHPFIVVMMPPAVAADIAGVLTVPIWYPVLISMFPH